MKNKHEIRKETPIYSGVLQYFPDAIAEVAKCSYIANEQHNPGTPMHWDRSKSTDELDALTRHLMDAGKMDDDNIRHSTKVAWRSLSNLQRELEDAGLAPHSPYNSLREQQDAEIDAWANSEPDTAVINN